MPMEEAYNIKVKIKVLNTYYFVVTWGKKEKKRKMRAGDVEHVPSIHETLGLAPQKKSTIMFITALSKEKYYNLKSLIRVKV